MDFQKVFKIVVGLIGSGYLFLSTYYCSWR